MHQNLAINCVTEKSVLYYWSQAMMTYPNYFHIYLMNLIFPCVLGLVTITIYYMHHEPLRRFLKLSLVNMIWGQTQITLVV